MNYDVICLRQESDFLRAGVKPPSSLKIAYRVQGDAELPTLMGTARGVLIGAVGPKLPADLFRNTMVKMVQVTGAGVDRVDEAALKQCGIAVCNVPGGSSAAVAEYSVTMASVLLRRFAWADHEVRAGSYAKFRARMSTDSVAGLEGLVVGIVGLGTIGLTTARAFHSMGSKIIFFDPAPREPQVVAELGAKFVTLEKLLRNSDVLSLHVPLLPATKGLIGSRELAMMKPSAVLIQASRGGVVDEAALVNRIESGQLEGAAVDVYSKEPPQADNPLFSLTGEAARRLLLTPHIAGVTRQSVAVLYKTAWDNIEHVLARGEEPRNRVY